MTDREIDIALNPLALAVDQRDAYRRILDTLLTALGECEQKQRAGGGCYCSKRHGKRSPCPVAAARAELDAIAHASASEAVLDGARKPSDGADGL